MTLFFFVNLRFVILSRFEQPHNGRGGFNQKSRLNTDQLTKPAPVSMYIAEFNINLLFVHNQYPLSPHP